MKRIKTPMRRKVLARLTAVNFEQERTGDPQYYKSFPERQYPFKKAGGEFTDDISVIDLATGVFLGTVIFNSSIIGYSESVVLWFLLFWLLVFINFFFFLISYTISQFLGISKEKYSSESFDSTTVIVPMCYTAMPLSLFLTLYLLYTHCWL